MEHRHIPPTLFYNEQYSNQPRRPAFNSSNIQPNFTVPPPPIIPNYNMPPSPSQHSTYSPTPHYPAWGPNSSTGNNVPFSSPLHFNIHSQQECTNVKGPISVISTLHLDQNIYQSNERARDEEWIRKYTMPKLGKPNCMSILNKSEEQFPKLKVFEAKHCFEQCQSLLQELKSFEKDLIETIESRSLQKWQESCDIIHAKKLRVLLNVHKLSNPLSIQHLKEAISKRQKKREAQKRRRTRQKEEKDACLKRRQQLHLSIDTWFEEMQQSVEKVKLEESLKHQADIVLSDVTRKKAEARRQLTLMSVLLKLRRVRVQMAANRGEHISIELANIFENVIEKLQTYWSDQLKGYNLEEKGLQVMLEEATEDTSKNTKSLHQRILSDWQRVMYGKNSFVDQFFTAAECDMDAFLAIRHDWDKFAVPPETHALMASSIPLGWVLPPNRPSSEQWEELLQAKQSKP